MAISTAVSDTNNALVLEAQHKDFVSIETGTFMFGGQLITPEELSEENYVSCVKRAHRKAQKKVVSTYLKNQLKAEFGDATDHYVDHEMNQWLDSKNDVIAHFKAFGREAPSTLVIALETVHVVFPDDLVFE